MAERHMLRLCVYVGGVKPRERQQETLQSGRCLRTAGSPSVGAFF